MTEKFKNIFLANNNPTQTIFKNIFWLSVSQISRLLRVGTLLYAARALGTSEYGVFAYILSIVGIFSIFSDMGVNGLLVRDTANHPERRREYFATSFWIKISLVALTCLLLFICAPHFIKIEAALYLIPIAGLLIIFDAVRDFIVAYIRGLEKMEGETLIVTVLNVVLAILGFTILVLYPSAEALLIVYTASSAVATLVSIVLARKQIFQIRNSFQKNIAQEIFKNGWPIALAGAFGLLMLNVDIIMLGLWRSASEIGLYAAGQKIVQVLYSVPALISIAIFPTTAAIIKTGDMEKEKVLNEKSMSAIFLFVIPLVVGGILLGKPIFSFVFGPEYIEGAVAFSLLLVNIFFIFPGVIIANLVLAHNQQGKMFKYVIAAALVNILLNIILIPKIGIVGAALATLVAQAINYGFTWYQIRKVSPFALFAHLQKAVIAVIFMGTASYLLNSLGFHVLGTIAVSATVYIGSLFILKEKTLSDLGGMVRQFRNRP